MNSCYHFNIGPLHVVMYSVEYYYFGNYYKEEDIRRQYEFIVKDLEEANKPENRRERPWILALTHRAMYCSTNDTDDCRYVTNRARVGHPKWGYGLEPVLQHYGVDLHYAGHEHTYERLYPVYNYKVYNGSNDAPYTNARAPIHVISGNPGNIEYPDKFVPDKPEWSAYRSSDYGFTVMTVHNTTHVHLQQHSINQVFHFYICVVLRCIHQPSSAHSQGKSERVLRMN
ncbi:ACP7 [Cordylochernes scorpioides]|uniref:ACP7 n=1 Tax=Cordylochernes scorpioides TaxID=51811 RepID=A0ABY6L0I6_9ARAC|nr:ACP7 [Cordylochernes scorpioides]